MSPTANSGFPRFVTFPIRWHFLRGVLRFTSLPPCKLKGREESELQFGEPLALWKPYQPPSFASIPANLLLLDAPLIIYQVTLSFAKAEVCVWWEGGVGVNAQGGTVRQLLFLISLPPRRVLTLLIVSWQVARAAIANFYGPKASMYCPGKRRTQNPSEN